MHTCVCLCAIWVSSRAYIFHAKERRCSELRARAHARESKAPKTWQVCDRMIESVEKRAPLQDAYDVHASSARGGGGGGGACFRAMRARL